MDDAGYMLRALRLARRGVGRVEPNPMVGCVIVRGDRIIGEGWHKKFGGAHAEVEALKVCRQAGHGARGATVYVTLEPCGHFGKTPPCADALIETGVERVVIGAMDPVAGHGSVAKLRETGIDVVAGVCEQEAQELIGSFTKVMTTGLPWVICKWATTIDGAIATASGDSKWISSDCSRRVVHQLRARVDAIVVGVNTVVKDDPMLNPRKFPRKQVRRIARRVVIDPTLRMPVDCKLVKTAGDVPVMVVCAEGAGNKALKQALIERGVEILEVPRDAIIARMLRHLVKAHGATNVLVEGGGKTHGTFLKRPGVVDELLVFVGPRVVGGGLRAVEGSGAAMIAEGSQWRLTQLKRIGDDVMMRYRARTSDS